MRSKCAIIKKDIKKDYKMDNLILEAIKIVNPVQLVLIGLIMFYFYDRLNDKIIKVDENLRLDLKSDNKELRAEFKSDMNELRSEFKSDMNTLEVKLNTLILGLFRSYQTPELPPKQDQH